MEPQYPPPYPPPLYGREKRGLPVWVWILVGCGCGVPLLFVPILAAILFPVFSQARLAARQAVCMKNLSQVSTGMLMYVQDYDERFPPAAYWMDVSLPYARNQSVYHCPAVSADPLAFGYAYNKSLSGVESRTIASPAMVPLTYDSTSLGRNASDAVTSLPEPPRHRRNNMGYADGHVAAVRRTSGPVPR